MECMHQVFKIGPVLRPNSGCNERNIAKKWPASGAAVVRCSALFPRARCLKGNPVTIHIKIMGLVKISALSFTEKPDFVPPFQKCQPQLMVWHFVYQPVFYTLLLWGIQFDTTLNG